MIKTLPLAFKLFFCFLFFNSYVVSQNSPIDSSQLLLLKKDTLQVNLNNISQSKDDILGKIMPWAVALSIGVLSAIVNIYLGYKQRKAGEVVINKQLEHNKEALEKQLEYNKQALLIQFKGNIASKNRQEWINELRNSLSEFITKSAIISLEKNSDLDEKQIQNDLDRLLYYKSKIELLLNHEKPEQEKVKKFVWELIKNLENKNFDMESFGENQKQLVLASRELFQMHWKKIKNLS